MMKGRTNIEIKPPYSIKDWGKLLVALSGGADSVALLRLLHQQTQDIEALHCNFQLRGRESERDERFVTNLCEQLGIRLHVKHFETREFAAEQGISIEMAARRLRYEWFEKMRIQRQADYIAVAHHRDDQVETVLLNLIRGTGLRGLAGMQAVNGHIIRPLLAYSKTDLIDYLSSIKQDYITDSTNYERDAQRNRIRLDVLPLLQQINPKAVEHIAQAASKVTEALPYYFKGVDNSEELSATTLHERLAGCGFTSAQEEAILKHIEGNSGAVFESATHRLLRDRGRIILQEKGKFAPVPVLKTRTIEVEDAKAFLKDQPLTPDYAYLDAEKVSLPLTLRHPRQGDRFQPFGMNGKSRLISDFLTDLKLTLFDKENQWLACNGDDIVWVVGLRSDHRYRVTSSTRKILILNL